jgi:hypothetical protein
MSRSTRWDYQLTKIEGALAALAREVARNPDPQAQDNVNRDRDQIDLSLAKIAIDCDKVVQISRKTQNHRRLDAAVGWWAKQLAGKLKIFASEYTALQNRKMWLRLLQARFSGISKRDSLDLEAKHLVDLASRKRHLEQMEEALKNDLENIALDREKLKAEYNAIGTADENWSASGSCQTRLGVNLQHARENAATRALSEYFRVISVPSLHPVEDSWLRSANADLISKTDLLSTEARELAASLASESGDADKLGMSAVKSAMEQVAGLSENIVRRFESLQNRPRTSLRPKIVQSSQKADKTMSHP